MFCKRQRALHTSFSPLSCLLLILIDITTKSQCPCRWPSLPRRISKRLAPNVTKNDVISHRDFGGILISQKNPSQPPDHPTNTGDGGPVPATNKITQTDCVYALKMNSDNKARNSDGRRKMSRRENQVILRISVWRTHRGSIHISFSKIDIVDQLPKNVKSNWYATIARFLGFCRAEPNTSMALKYGSNYKQQIRRLPLQLAI